jgi:hypothetical protein
MVKTKILEHFENIQDKDIVITSSGDTGEDLKFSPYARNILPISIECKNRKAFSIIRDYEQAERNCDGNEPVLVIKENRGEPLVLIDLDYFLKLHANAQ